MKIRRDKRAIASKIIYIRKGNCPFCEQKTIITKAKDEDNESYYTCSKCGESFYNTKDFLTNDELKGGEKICV